MGPGEELTIDVPWKDDPVRIATHRCLCGYMPSVLWYGGGGCEITCESCGLSVGDFPDPVKGIEKWNACLQPHYD